MVSTENVFMDLEEENHETLEEATQNSYNCALSGLRILGCFVFFRAKEELLYVEQNFFTS